MVKLGVSSIESLPLIFINWFDAGSTTLNVIGELPVVGFVKDIMKPFLTGKPWGGLLSLGIRTTFLPDLFKIFTDM